LQGTDLKHNPSSISLTTASSRLSKQKTQVLPLRTFDDIILFCLSRRVDSEELTSRQSRERQINHFSL
jgi:hypothetical protein